MKIAFKWRIEKFDRANENGDEYQDISEPLLGHCCVFVSSPLMMFEKYFRLLVNGRS